MRMKNSSSNSTIGFALIALFSAGAIRAEARFASLKGTVQIYQNQKWIDANPSMKLPSGTMIQTAYRSSAVVIYPSGGQIALGPNTQITIFDNLVTSGTDREVLIAHGQVSGFVKKGTGGERNGFRLRTPTVVAGVRGSLISGLLVGQTLSVEAIQSAANLALAPANRANQTAETRLAATRAKISSAQNGIASRERLIKDLKAAIQKKETEMSQRGQSGDQINFNLNRDPKVIEMRLWIKEAEYTRDKYKVELGSQVSLEKIRVAEAEAAREKLNAVIAAVNAEEKKLLTEFAAAEAKAQAERVAADKAKAAADTAKTQELVAAAKKTAAAEEEKISKLSATMKTTEAEYAAAKAAAANATGDEKIKAETKASQLESLMASYKRGMRVFEARASVARSGVEKAEAIAADAQGNKAARLAETLKATDKQILAAKAVVPPEEVLKDLEDRIKSLEEQKAAVKAQEEKAPEDKKAAWRSQIASFDRNIKDAQEKAVIARAAVEQSSAQGSTIKQGDQARANGATIVSPAEVVQVSTRPAQMTTVGQTGTEQQFLKQTDVKVGVGNDSQQLYNNINAVTQPTSTGLPTLKKL